MDPSRENSPPEWFEQWIHAHYERIRRAAFVLCGHSADADDLAQETFLRLLSTRSQFSGKSSPETWLYAILLNAHRQRCRSNQRLWRRWCEWWNGHGSKAVSVPPDAQIHSREWAESIWGAVAQLPVAQRQAIVLRYAEQLSYEEIAEVLECPVGTVRSRLHAATATLRERLPPDVVLQPVEQETTPCLAR